MTHIEQGELQAYLDHEVTLAARAHIEAHIRTCTVCAAELNRLRTASTLFASAMRSTDAEAPTLPALAAVSAARGDVARRRFALSRSALAKAAVFMIGFAALASAAIPGSPLHNWISTALTTVRSPTPKPSATPARANERRTARVIAPSADAAALSIQPSDGRVRIVLTNIAPDALIRVKLVDSYRAVVQATGAAAHARFRTGPGRIEMLDVDKGEVTIELPRSVFDARVEVDGRVLFQKDRDQLHINEAARIGSGSEFLFKAGQR